MGKKNGFGTQTWKDGTVYSGEWQNDQFHGFGYHKRSGKDAYSFVGSWKENLCDGYGELKWNGNRYEGMFSDAK